MAGRFEQWREADRVAHEAERRVRSRVRQAGDSQESERADIERARRLRAIADGFFDAAMQELGNEVHQLIQARTPGGPGHRSPAPR